MIAEVSRTLAAYGKLDAQGRRLFREELGLVRPRKAQRRRASSAPAAPVVATPRRVKARHVQPEAPAEPGN